jgi:transposase
MRSYPEINSVLVLDNAQIHHNQSLIELINAIGAQVLFLPPYSPDFNPIETAFSFIKGYLKRNREFVQESADPIYLILVACAEISSDIAKKFVEHSKIYL